MIHFSIVRTTVAKSAIVAHEYSDWIYFLSWNYIFSFPGIYVNS